MSQFDGRNGYHPTYGSTQVKNLCIVLIIHWFSDKTQTQ
jgi:hypothetical protein